MWDCIRCENDRVDKWFEEQHWHTIEKIELEDM